MAQRRGRSISPQKRDPPPAAMAYSEDDSMLHSRQLEAFGRTVTATASSLISSNFSNDNGNGPDHYRSALSSVHRSMRRPAFQRSVFSFAKANPRELIRSNFNTSEIEHRALTWLPDDLIKNAPESASPFSLFEGFKASLPDDDADRTGKRKKHGRQGSRGQKLLEGMDEEKGPPQLLRLKREKGRLDHRLEMMGVRKTMCSSEIREIDSKISNLNTMRKVVLERLAGLEQEEHELEVEIGDMALRLDDLQEQFEDEVARSTKSPALKPVVEEKGLASEEINQGDTAADFMSESIYQKLPKTNETPKPKRKKLPRRTVSMPVLHEHMEPGSRIREMQAHNDMITAVDFDAPFGTLVTAALDDTVRVWDLNAGRCMGMLEGHLSSVRCLQVEENLVATGSMDASIKLWDLNQADYTPPPASTIPEEGEPEGDELFTPATAEDQAKMQQAPEAHGNGMADCHLFTLSAHVAEITALHFRGTTLVSGSADKTLRQWDLEKGRCVQTLDVLWAAAQASTINPSITPAPAAADVAGGWWRPTAGRLPAAEADFVGTLQVFETALACGTADGMVRLWDLRSGMVHRSLVGHTGPVTALQFDDVYMVTASLDRSIRVSSRALHEAPIIRPVPNNLSQIWDLRTGTIHDAYAYDSPVTSMQFDARRIIAAAGEDVVKVYDKTDGRQWDCGAGVEAVEDASPRPSVVERVCIKDGYLVEGRKDGVVGTWSC
nr:mitochondrial division protein 1 [Quercus suber]